MDIILLAIQVFVVYTGYIPELRSTQKDSEGHFINEEGKRIQWYSNPYLIVNISCVTTLLSIAATIVNAYFEAESLNEDFHQHWMTSI
jgi:hypothetical protein